MKRLIATLALAVAAPALAQSGSRAPAGGEISSSLLTVPVMANNPGQFGSFFRTRVSLMNPTNLSYDVKATLYDATGVPKVATISMAPGQIRSYDNFLEAVFAFTGAGTVRLDSRASAAGSAALFVFSSEVYTEGATGSFGTTAPASPFGGTAAASFAAGVSVNSSFRTNLGCFNDSSSTVSIPADVYDPSGTKLETVTLDLPATGWNQKGVTQSVTGGYVKFRPAKPAYCYAVVVHNVSNDGRFIPGAEYEP